MGKRRLTIARKSRRREPACRFHKAHHRRRNVVERSFHRLKQRRGIATR
ncbi:hypothetical protein [Streptomyces vinaceus]